MNGVRVQDIEPQCPERMVWQYFYDLCGKGAIASVYYPVLNNNAIVIFKDVSMAVKALTSKHEKWSVLPLPNQVFFKQRVWLEKELTDLLFEQEHHQDILKDLGHVDISVEKGIMMLTGHFYQIEWAWRYLSDLHDQLQHRSGAFHSAPMSGTTSSLHNGDSLTNGDIGHRSVHHKSHAGHSSLASPRLHIDDARFQSGNVVSSSGARSLAVEGASGGRRLPSPSSSAAGSSGSSPRVQDRENEAGRMKPAPSDVTSLAIEGLSDERPASSASSVSAGISGASLAQQERAVSAQSGTASKSRAAPLKVISTNIDYRTMAMGDLGQSLISQPSRHIDAEDDVSGYASHPVRNSGVVRNSPEQVDIPAHSTSRSGRAFSQTVPNTTDLDKGEAAHRVMLRSQSMNYQPPAPQDDNDAHRVMRRHQSMISQPPVSQYDNNVHRAVQRPQSMSYQAVVPQDDAHRMERYHPPMSQDDEDADRVALQYQSMGYQPPALQDEDYEYGAVGGPQSVSPWTGGPGEDPDYYDMDSGGQRPFSSLPHFSNSSMLKHPSSKYSFENRSVIELSRKHFDVAHRLKLKIYKDDITRTKTDAVVNAANWELKNIGGVAGALAKAAGPEMERECDRIYREKGALRTAQVVRTKAYGKLGHLKYVIHTVGPIYRRDDPDKCVFELAQTFLNSLLLADKLNLESLTFPFISTGIFGMPVELCVLALLTALKKYGKERYQKLSTLEEVHFIHNDIDVVCNAVFYAEMAAKTETLEICLKRMEDGEKLYGGSVYPFCDQKAPSASNGSSREDRYTALDSSGDRDTIAEEEGSSRSRHRHRQRSDQDQLATGLQSLPVAHQKSSSSSRTRSQSADRGSKTVAASDSKSSSNAKGRDPSPIPRPRSRSNSMTSTNKSSSGTATKAGSSPTGATTSVTARTQPQIKQSIVPSASSGKKRSMNLAKSVGRGRTSDQSGNDTDLSSAAASETEDTDRTCPICLDEVSQPKKLPCGHRFCAQCVDRAMAVAPRCPKCQRMFGIPTGTQPSDGRMDHSIDYRSHLDGYPGCGTITITYNFPAGRQEACHPNPGRRYDSTHRVAYLPANPEGREVLKMLQRAFDHRLMFTIGDSVTTGAKGVITWNDIHHKTSTYGGPSEFGYPDPDYLRRVKEELAAKGITHP